MEQPSHCTQLISPTAAERSGTKNCWKIFSFRSLKNLFQTLDFKLKFLLLIFEETNPLWETFFEEIVKGLLKENYYVLNKIKIQYNSASIVLCFVRKHLTLLPIITKHGVLIRVRWLTVCIV